MKILFVYPDDTRGRFKPIGIALLSAILKREGHEVSVFDQSDYVFETPGDKAGVDLLLFKRFTYPPHLKFVPTKSVEEGFREAVNSFQPDILAFSVTYLLFNNALKLVRSLGKRQVPTIFGGIHVTLNPDDVISRDEVDILCRGEGEEPFVELLERMQNGQDITDIPNIWVKSKGRIFRNEMRPMRETLDDLPLADWSVFPDHHFYKPYVGRIYRGGDIIVSRGCYNSCSYCFYHAYYQAYGMRKHKVLFMSPKRAMEEIRNLAVNYGATLIKLRDADFAARSEEDLQEMTRLSKELGPRMPKLLCNVYHGHVTREKARLMRELNMVSVSVGLESGSDELRRTCLNRRANNDKFYLVSKWFRDEGIRLTTSNMIGLPYETRENIFETIEVNRKAEVDLADVSILYPFPGTRIHDFCKELGLLKRDLSQQSYYRGEPVLDMPQISRSELQGMMRTFQLYMNSPRWFFPFIRPAERESPSGLLYLKLLQKVFYVYIFHFRQIFRAMKRSLNGAEGHS